MASIFLQLAEKILSDEQKPLSLSEIWNSISSKGLDKNNNIGGKTPWDTLASALYVDVRDNPNSIFSAVGLRPKRFILKQWIGKMDFGQLQEQQDSQAISKFTYLEKDTHPFLAYYCWFNRSIVVKTIHHTYSSKSKFGEWVHPDVIGCYFPFIDLKKEVFEISAALGNNSLKLFSFEIKRELTFSNLREAFFQAVSNSSWANEGYLVASEMQEGNEFHDELERLSNAFGIGVIRLHLDDPDSSEEIFPAKRKENIDWETVNKLSEMNPDYREFLRQIKTDLSINEIRKEKYDKIEEREALLKIIKN